MKKIVTIVVVALGLMATGNQAKAQTKIGYISLNELIASMPESKKADTSYSDFQNALSQQYEDYNKELREQDSMLQSKDTAKLTKAQLEVKRRAFSELYIKVQGFQQQASQQLQQKQQELLAPIQKKAIEAAQAVAKENGYAYVFVKDVLIAYPPADDLMPLVKKKLNIK
ncbi:MAG: OmpH family outer membrane protein [Bacteroidetes bacterium]|nr:OmpH family outer membrane protein [Bacteroidota bacterium]MBS1933089.1 OmpH family outer membrane protein [Bacteroidota bacterium]